MRSPFLFSFYFLVCIGLTMEVCAATLTVNSSEDSDQGDSALSLREAIALAAGTLGRPISTAERDQIAGATFNSAGINSWNPASGIGANTGDGINFTSGVDVIALTGPLPSIGRDDNLNGNRGGGLKVTLDGLDDSFGALVILAATETTNGISNLVIRNFGGAGVSAFGLQSGVIEGLEIYNCEDGIVVAPFDDGINQANPRGNRIGGNSVQNRNYIYGNTRDGIRLFAAGGFDTSGDLGNLILFNHVGLNPAGEPMGNGRHGILIEQAWGNTIGAGSLGSANVVCANGEDGIRLVGATANDNLIIGNRVGVSADGLVKMGNLKNGIALVDGAGANLLEARAANRIGGNLQDNVIGGNEIGILISGETTEGNEIFGNYIGTNPTGADLGNSLAGIAIYEGASGTVVDNTTSDLATIGFNGIGIEIAGGDTAFNVVESAYLGARGTALQPNGIGVRIADGATSNTIGAAMPDFPNRIGGNIGPGVVISGEGTEGNQILGNLIGTASASLEAVPNLLGGVLIELGASNNEITGNTIARNFGAGVAVTEGIRNRIRQNRFSGNAGLSIDLGEVGMSSNDVGDNDAGPNDYVNFPDRVISQDDAGAVRVMGEYFGAPNSSFVLDFYYTRECGLGGSMHDTVFIGTIPTLITNASGFASYTSNFSSVAYQSFPVVAIATDAFGNTSEFSPCSLNSVRRWMGYE